MCKPWHTVLLLVSWSPIGAQWIGYPTPDLPRTADGKPDLFARTPRTRDGHPDLSGVWHVQAESTEEKRRLFGANVGGFDVPGMESFTTSKYSNDMLLDFRQGDVILSPEGQAIQKAAQAAAKGGGTCMPIGAPRSMHLSEVFKIVQTPKLMLMMLEGDPNRQIYTDGRLLPKDPNPSWQGYSIGRWEKDTLVVETVGFNGKTFLDFRLHPVSEDMRITERYTRRDTGHMEIEWKFNDPRIYNKPFSVKIQYLLQPDTDILEYVCENEKDSIHLPK